ncbi:DUF1329 domain-containing protein [Azohydromonas caseinilytica]|uniref:DUF1329 domain-containing protein n=1 Tax=Azohydromonas caseinilytica TaxID=2728836 RepID=A0A848FEX3_9BURK|nr:DUF1329 domain-containing protein [Azohydromonas caseinilytica]NML16700.1 DUF1329 domain-containing protein [Azohydromonas caseinilytica]
MKMSFSMAVVAAGLLAAGSAAAKVGAAEAERLGKDLTCVGAEKAGNKDGTIPEFSGKWQGTPPGLKYTPHVGQHPVDPYPDDKPLFSITAENLEQYAAQLSEGQKVLFAKLPKTYRIPVYPGRRDFRYPDAVCEIARKNALEAEVTHNGLAVKAYKGALPFPIPKSGIEALYNSLLPSRAFNESITRDFANVLPGGAITWGRATNNNLDNTNDPAQRGKPMEGVMAYSRNAVLLPEREKGNVNVSAEPLNFATNKRLAWNYDPGTRRVRQLPEYGFDQPLNGTSGKLTIDADRLFNGSPERYDWKLVGKREMFIPANAYRIHANTVKYADLIKPAHPNPEYLRYELRRVWVVEGTLKEGFRHMFGKRVLFLDEDTGQAVMSDFYDARGTLWQHAFINYYYSPDINAWHAGTSFYFDLNSGGYIAYNLFQEAKLGPVLNKGNLTPAMFTPEAARTAGN